MLSSNAVRIMTIMFAAAVVMNAMNYFFCSLYSAHRPAPAQNNEDNILKFTRKESQPAGVHSKLAKLIRVSAPRSPAPESSPERVRVESSARTGQPSPSDYDTTTDTLTTSSTFGTPTSSSKLRQSVITNLF